MSDADGGQVPCDGKIFRAINHRIDTAMPSDSYGGFLFSIYVQKNQVS